MSRPSVCFIGAGPCTLSALHFLLQQDSALLPEIAVYEKQSAFGGMWQEQDNWRVGTDKYGLPIHHSMYKDLWSNGPKECLELPDWTFQDCFKKNIPSFPPRIIIAEYITGRGKNDAVERFINLNTVVTYVDYDKQTSKFTVSVENLITGYHSQRTFDYVVVATGHFSTPNVPTFPGIETFPGRILHSHDYRSGFEFLQQDILVVGSSYSAEDISLQTLKFGAKSVTVSYRNNKMDLHNWPSLFKGQRPSIKMIKGSTVTFADGTTGDFDSIILCTGYLHYFPFLSPSLRLNTSNILYPPLYKGVVFPSNPKLLYMGMQDLYYTFTMFDIQGLWITQYILGKQPIKSEIEMREDIKKWQKLENNPKISNTPKWKTDIDFQSDYLNELVELTNYPHKLDCREILYQWEHNRHDNIVTYRDQAFTSMFTNELSPVPHTKWWNAFNDSKEAFMNQDQRMEPQQELFVYRGTKTQRGKENKGGVKNCTGCVVALVLATAACLAFWMCNW